MLKLAEDKASAPNAPENGSGSSNAGSSKEEDSENGKESAAPEIPNIEEGGVCIDFDQQQQSQRKNISKPHTRHNTAVQQQALSV